MAERRATFDVGNVVAFGRALRALRGSRSQVEIADSIGVSQDTISKLEQGKIDQPSFQLLVGLGKHVFGVDPNTIAAFLGVYPPPVDDQLQPDARRALEQLRVMFHRLSPAEQDYLALLVEDDLKVMRVRIDAEGDNLLPSWFRRRQAE